MGVMACDRNGCENILCDRYSHRYGYICNDCYDELVDSEMEISEFMESPKDVLSLANVSDREEVLNGVFRKA